MSHTAQLSLPMAILININIMLGAGIFLNSTLLAQQAGGLGFVSYALIGILLLPLVISISQLLTMHPKGGFYAFGQQEMSPFAGFVSAWSYFSAKLASATVIIHTSVVTIMQLLPALQVFHPFALDCIIIALFCGLNMFNIRTSSSIQMAFTILKAIPILFVILAGFFLFQGDHYVSTNLLWTGVPGTLPLVIYATMGFEAACSLSGNIKDPARNAPLAVLISYGIALCIIMLYQFCFYGALGPVLALQPSYREAFSHLTGLLTTTKIGGIFSLAIASSALGGSYGILFSNSWNLHTLATHNHVFFSRIFSELNKHAIPFACIIVEGLLCVTYLFASQGIQTTLQQLASLGTVLAYTMSVLALLAAKRRLDAPSKGYIIPALGLFNCTLLIAACVRGLVYTGTTGLIYFICLFILGVIMYFATKQTMPPSDQTQGLVSNN